MHNLKWSDSEKKLSRRVFESALQKELADTVTEFKAMAASINTIDQMWPLRDYLHDKQREIDFKYDYRYSQLIRVFGVLLRERRIEEKDLKGLSEEKMDAIRRFAGL